MWTCLHYVTYSLTTVTHLAYILASQDRQDLD